MAVKNTRLTELLELGQEQEEDRLDLHGGYFDEQMNYHYHNASPLCEVLYPSDWIHHPDIVQQARHLGLPVPEDPVIDPRSTF